MTVLSSMNEPRHGGLACKQLQGASSACRRDDVLHGVRVQARALIRCGQVAALAHNGNLTCWLRIQCTRWLSWQYRVRHTACTLITIGHWPSGHDSSAHHMEPGCRQPWRCQCCLRWAKCAAVWRRDPADVTQAAHSMGHWRSDHACWRAGHPQRCLGTSAFGPLAGGPSL